MASRFSRMFPRAHGNIIGMIHVPALPGAPLYGKRFRLLLDTVERDAKIYVRCGVQGLLVANMHDVPYVRRNVGPEVTASMTVVCRAVRKIAPWTMPCGVQILAGANKEALAVAQAAHFQFVRAEGFDFSHVADEGWMDGDAAELMQYRRAISAEQISVMCDIKKKHSSRAVTSDVSVAAMAKAAEHFCADGVILTGSCTGDAAQASDLQSVDSATQLPKIIGSGITDANFTKYDRAQAFIVGSHFKKGGHWRGEVCEAKVRSLVAACAQHYKNSRKFTAATINRCSL